ncbi:hypothetical protein, conserved in T. vivax, partial [Trypanosoma vivax Y486]
CTSRSGHAPSSGWCSGGLLSPHPLPDHMVLSAPCATLARSTVYRDAMARALSRTPSPLPFAPLAPAVRLLQVGVLVACCPPTRSQTIWS